MITDCIYVLGLERLKERAQDVIERLNKLELNSSNQKIVWWKAIDGSTELPLGKEVYNTNDNSKKQELIKEMNSVLQDHKYLSKRIPIPMKPGQIGVYASFINIIRDAKKNQYKNIIFFEDDVFFTNNFLEEMKFVNSLKEEVVFLGSSHEYWNEKYKKDEATSYRCPSKKVNNKLVEYPVGCLSKNMEERDNSFLGTFAVFIRSSAFDTILKYAYPMRYPLDVYIGKLYFEKLISTIFLSKPIVFVDYENGVSHTSGLNLVGASYKQ